MAGYPWDTQGWADLVKPVQDGYQAAMAKYGRLQTLTGRADDIADREFPNSARDASTKNAFRHSLGTGMLAQELGGGPIAAGAAKAVGLGWEALGALGLPGNKAAQQDTLHDLNANAVGALATQYQTDQAGLVAHLKRLAQEAPVVQPRGFFEPSRGNLTRTVQ